MESSHAGKKGKDVRIPASTSNGFRLFGSKNTSPLVETHQYGGIKVYKSSTGQRRINNGLIIKITLASALTIAAIGTYISGFERGSSITELQQKTIRALQSITKDLGDRNSKLIYELNTAKQTNRELRETDLKHRREIDSLKSRRRKRR